MAKCHSASTGIRLQSHEADRAARAHSSQIHVRRAGAITKYEAASAPRTRGPLARRGRKVQLARRRRRHALRPACC